MTSFEEVVISGFVSKAVNNCVDVSWHKIKKAAENKKTKNKNLESQIYNVTVDVLNSIADNQFKSNQDNIYNSAEVLLKSFKNSEENELGHIKSCLQTLCSNVDEDKCIQFKILLYETLGKNEYCELFRTILLLLREQNKQYDHNIHQQIIKKLDEIILVLNKKKDNENSNSQFKVKSRTQEYADKWNANMFLNDFNKRDENAGINVSLKDVYLEKHLPHYIWRENENESDDLKELLTEFIDDNKIRTLLILGQPGIGKTTLITWLIVNFILHKEDILVYNFASDLNKIDWNCRKNIENYKYWDDILELLGLTYDTLNGKILIFDGFDEINIHISRINILNKLLSRKFKMMNSNFKVIVTCRENYIRELSRAEYDFITLLPWNKKQIENFCMVYSKKIQYNISENMMKIIEKNKKVLGIPLILYMVLALNISIEENGSIVDIYDKIFSLKGGIYDRCIENKSFADIHRIGEIKAQIHQISREIAIWMFENNPNEAFIPQLEYQRICIDIKRNSEKGIENINQDFLIGNYFKLVKHCEGNETEELYFVHRTIYEYFVAETIYSSVENAMINLTNDNQEDLAGNIAFYLKEGKITNTIGEFLFRKIKNLYNKLNTEKKQEFYQWWESAIEKMIEVGMFYYTKRNIQDYENIIKKEKNCFLNLLTILRLLLPLTNRKYIMKNVNMCKIIDYISLGQREDYSYLFLEGADLKEANLSEANLSKANLSVAHLIGANLRKANLSGTDLSGADLSGVNLIGANLIRANLIGAYLIGADLREAHLDGADLREAHLDGANLREAHLDGANLIGANLIGADLREAHLDGANLRETHLMRAKFNESKI
ncbi:MAG: pentapeptide repeat-containing protein [Lachnospiraceae bacterium]|nr:pentapeptide repeat-containing protein [Lachnospiraceae bacterium]